MLFLVRRYFLSFTNSGSFCQQKLSKIHNPVNFSGSEAPNDEYCVFFSYIFHVFFCMARTSKHNTRIIYVTENGSRLDFKQYSHFFSICLLVVVVNTMYAGTCRGRAGRLSGWLVGEWGPAQ